MADYLIGIDNGGSEIKCAIYDKDGHEVHVERKRVPMQMRAPGYTERDPKTVWDANAHVIKNAVVNSNVNPDEIRSIGLTGYGNGMLLVDKKGNPTSNCIISTDSRASEYCKHFKENGAERLIYPKTYQTIWSAQPAALIPWFRDNEKNILNKSDLYLGIKDWIRFCLTGEFATEMTEASSTCLYNINEKKFDPEIFEALGIKEYFKLMPKCVESTDISGFLTQTAANQTGLKPNTPVIGGYFDIDANALASGLLHEDVLCLIAGTWSINEYISKSVNTNYDFNKNTVTMSYLSDYFLIEDSTATSASNFDWFINQFIKPERPTVPLRKIYQECDALIENMDPKKGEIVFMPFLFDSPNRLNAKAAFFNMAGNDTLSEILQAIYEGIVFSSALHVENLQHPKKQFSIARLSGGISHSPVWSQMMADVLQIPVELPEGSELAAKGSAIGAAVAIGLYPDLQAAVNSMTKIKKVYKPRTEYASAYEKKFKNFKKALHALEVFHS